MSTPSDEPKKIKLHPEVRDKLKAAAHAYANPKTKVIQSYCRLHDAFQAGALWAIQTGDAFQEFGEALAKAQQSIPPDIQKVINENFWDMIGDDEKYPNPLS